MTWRVPFLKLSRLSGAGVLAASVHVSRFAAACPACAGNPDGGIARYVLVTLMIAAPYVATVVVIRLVKEGEAALRTSEKDTAGRAERAP